MPVSVSHRRPDPLLVRFAVASALLHLFALGWIRNLQHDPARPDAMLIELVAPQGPTKSPSADPTPPAPPRAAPQAEPGPRTSTARPEVTPKPAAKPQAPPHKKQKKTKKASRKPVATPAKTQTPPKPAAEPAQPQATADSEQNDTSSPGQTLDDIRRLLQQRSGGAVGGGAGATGHALPQGIQGRLYFNQLVAAIRAAWAVPAGAAREPVEVDVRIDARGRVLEATLRKSSGDPLLDRSALQAIRTADIPPPPADFRTPLQLTFRLIPPEG